MKENERQLLQAYFEKKKLEEETRELTFRPQITEYPGIVRIRSVYIARLLTLCYNDSPTMVLCLIVSIKDRRSQRADQAEVLWAVTLPNLLFWFLQRSYVLLRFRKSYFFYHTFAIYGMYSNVLLCSVAL